MPGAILAADLGIGILVPGRKRIQVRRGDAEGVPAIDTSPAQQLRYRLAAMCRTDVH